MINLIISIISIYLFICFAFINYSYLFIIASQNNFFLKYLLKFYSFLYKNRKIYKIFYYLSLKQLTMGNITLTIIYGINNEYLRYFREYFYNKKNKIVVNFLDSIIYDRDRKYYEELKTNNLL